MDSAYTYNTDGTVTVGEDLSVYAPVGYSHVIALNPFSSLSLLRSFINEAIRETVTSNRWRGNNEDTYRIVSQLRYAASEIDKVIASGVYTSETAQD